MQADFNQTWSEAWKQKNFKIQLIAFLAVLLLVAILIPHFFIFVQERNGFTLHDPLLQLIPPADFSSFTFTLIYSALITAIISFSFSPWLILRGLQAYCILIFIRVICIWLVPLNDPPGIIVLNDPFVDLIGYGENIITKDLFFSGHTSTLFLLFLIARKRSIKIIFLATTIVVATFLLLQHVHYSVDVFAAPIFSWLSYRICFGGMKRRKILPI